MATPDRAKPLSASEILHTQEFGFEADFADLAARFAAKSGGGLSPELSAELALEIVLNEIVEQACQITGATGAAIILDGDGELQCRASSGSTALELGSRIERFTGLAGECVRCRKTVWCDDILTDARAERDALKQLGIRSVIIMPLLQGDTLVGIFGLFSTESYGFGVRDERTLEILAERVLTNLAHAAQPVDGQLEFVGAASDLQEENLQKIGFQDVALEPLTVESLGVSAADTTNTDSMRVGFPDSFPQNRPTAVPDAKRIEEESHPPGTTEFDSEFPDFDPAEMTPADLQALLKNAGVMMPEPPVAATPVEPPKKAEPAPVTPPPVPVAKIPAPHKPVDYVNWALGFAVVSVAVLLGLVLGQHFVLNHGHTPARAASIVPAAVPPRTASDPGQVPVSTMPAGVPDSNAVKPAQKTPDVTATGSRPSNSSASHEGAGADPAVPPGGLLVLQNGKEVFRLAPEKTSADASAEQAIQPASNRESDADHNAVVDVPESISQRDVLHRVEPEYPEAARDQNIQGLVVLDVHIATNGTVDTVQVVSGLQPLAQASTDAVKQWKFRPRVVNGRPVEMQTRVTFNFKLPQ